MPLDPSFVPALEEELRMAKNLKPGGQKTDPGRIAAIEEQIRLHSGAKSKEAPAEDASNKSTDYTSDETEKSRRARAKAAAKAETVDAVAAKNDDVETTDA